MAMSRNAVRSFLLNAAVQQLRRPSRSLGWLGDAPLSADQIAAVAAGAGFQGNDLPTAVAIALAESSGRANVYNPSMRAQGKTVVGLWQIYLDVHPEFNGWDLEDPATNAQAAFTLFSRRGNFNDWETYTNGAYLRYMSQAQAGVMAFLNSGQVANPDGLNTVMPDGRVVDPAGNVVASVPPGSMPGSPQLRSPAIGIIAAAATFLAVDYLFLRD